MKKQWLYLLLGGLAVIVLGTLIFRTETEASVDLMVQPTVGPFKVAVTTTGELQAKNSVKINGPIGAREARIYEMKIMRLVPEGTLVKPGDFVAELDRSELTTQIKDAQLEVDKAMSLYTQTRLDTSLTLSEGRDKLINLQYAMEEAKLQREEATYEPPSVKRKAEIDFEKAERAYARGIDTYDTQIQQGIAQMQEVRAELTKAQNKLEVLLNLAQQFTITAPDEGMVIYRRSWRGDRLTEGSSVNAWDPVVAELPDLTAMESKTYVNEIDIQRIREGQPVEIGLDAMQDKTLSGEVTRVANIGEQRPNSDAKVFEVTITVDQPDSTLRPAMTTSNTIVVAGIPEAMQIPLETLHAQDSLNFVYVNRGGRLERQEVLLGLLNENAAIVEAGLDPDDELYLSLPENGADAPLVRLDGTGEAEKEEPLAAQPNAQ